MPQPQAFGYEQVFTELLRGVVDTVADKPGLSAERKAAAQQAAVCSVMAFNPRDPVETMLAGHCVVYDHMLRDGARDMIRGQAELLLIQARPGILAAGKIFLGALSMLLRMQRRPHVELALARPLPVQEEAVEPRQAVPVAAAEQSPPADVARPMPDVASGQPAPQIAPAAPKDVVGAPVATVARASPAPIQRPAVPMSHQAMPVTQRNVPTPGRAAPDMKYPVANEQIAAAAALLARDGRQPRSSDLVPRARRESDQIATGPVTNAV